MISTLECSSADINFNPSETITLQFLDNLIKSLPTLFICGDYQKIYYTGTIIDLKITFFNEYSGLTRFQKTILERFINEIPNFISSDHYEFGLL